MSLCDVKRELRTAVKLGLATLRDEAIAAQSAAVVAKLVALPEWQQSGAVACYYSMRNEVSTQAILEAAFASGKRVYMPRVESMKTRKMNMLEAHSWADVAGWPLSKWGIAEPPVGRKDAMVDSLGLVVVPGVAFDSACGRLGHGAGFYDTWFERLAEGGLAMPLLVGVALEPQILNGIPTEPHDVTIDLVISPENTFTKKQ